MLASLIIPYYKDLVALELVLTALNKQSAKNRFEVVIAEDDNDPETKKFLDKHKASFQFEIQHVTQEDKGYRRSKALNNGIKVAKNELIIFIDGDCIPHRHFIKNYLAEAKENLLLYGRRVNLGEKISNQLRQSKKLFSLSFFSLLLSDSNRVTEGVYLPFYPNCLKSKRQPWGCNMGALKKNIIAINGFDEDYLEWGPEDLDFCHRLIQSGADTRSVKFQSIIYHLHHTSKGAAEVIKRGKKIFDEKVNSGIIFCKNGLTKI